MVVCNDIARQGNDKLSVKLAALQTPPNKGKQLQEKFFENLQLNIDNPAIETEFQTHEAWKEKTKLRATPTVLVNGYKLPDNYKIEDLRYFERLKIED